MRLANQIETKGGHSDLEVPYRRAHAQQIKGILEIVGFCFSRVLINGDIWHLDVNSSNFRIIKGSKGLVVCHSLVDCLC